MAYPVAMDTHPSLPPDLWERTPPAIRAHIETLEGQVQTLTSMVHTLQEQVRSIHLRRDSLSSITYSEKLNSGKSSATLQSTDRHYGIVGQKRSHFQRDS